MKIKKMVDRHMCSEFLVKDRVLAEGLGRLAEARDGGEIEDVGAESEFPDNR